jgi:UTP--glucose-1-phosphate uridylyltransferase
VFAPGIFKALQQTPAGKGGEIQLTDAIRLIIQEGGKVLGMRLRKDERRFDIGNYDAYFRAFVEFALADKRYGAGLRKFLGQLLNERHP